MSDGIKLKPCPIYAQQPFDVLSDVSVYCSTAACGFKTRSVEEWNAIEREEDRMREFGIKCVQKYMWSVCTTTHDEGIANAVSWSRATEIVDEVLGLKQEAADAPR